MLVVFLGDFSTSDVVLHSQIRKVSFSSRTRKQTAMLTLHAFAPE